MSSALQDPQAVRESQEFPEVSDDSYVTRRDQLEKARAMVRVVVREKMRRSQQQLQRARFAKHSLQMKTILQRMNQAQHMKN